MRIRLTIEYDGTRFHGWQLQPVGPTVQGELERALGVVLRCPVRVVAAGRTDAGVHACGQVAAFDVPGPVDLSTLARSLTAVTAPAIAVIAAEVVPDDFDPRRHARRRSYAYRIVNRAAPSPLWEGRAWHVRRPLQVAAMNAAAALLVGVHDFSAFRDAQCDAATAIRRVFRSEVRRAGDLITYDIEATAFLRHMVRSIVGTLVPVGAGVLTVERFGAILETRDRRAAGRTAPAHGLYLVGVSYE